MRNMMTFVVLSSLVLVLTGCWGQKEIDTESYVTSLGVDYKSGEFILYGQSLHFGNIAKTDGSGFKKQPNLIIEAKGVSIQNAYNTLQQITAMPLHLGHVQSIILSENIMKDKMPDVMELIGESPLIRYSVLLFGTSENIKEVMQSESFFHSSLSNSILYKPNALISRNYTVPILRYNRFTSRYYRKIGTILIPSLTINKKDFTEEKEKNILALNGEYIVSQQQYKGWLSKQDLIGMKWFNKGIHDYTLTVDSEKLSVSVKNTKTKIEVLKGDKPSYKVVVKGSGVIVNNVEAKSWDTVEKKLNEQIENDIFATIKKGVGLKSDVLNISEKAYKYHLDDWNVIAIKDFNEESIKEIEVMIQIKQAGGYKR